MSLSSVDCTYVSSWYRRAYLAKRGVYPIEGEALKRYRDVIEEVQPPTVEHWYNLEELLRVERGETFKSNTELYLESLSGLFQLLPKPLK